jgi:hypothetical protein
MGMMDSGTVACTSCHGPEGRGGRLQMMMQTFDAPDIRYKTLTSEGMAHGHDGQTWLLLVDTPQQPAELRLRDEIV